MTVKFALPPRGTNLVVGMTFMSIKNELKVLPEMTPVEDDCDLLMPVVVACDSFELVVVIAPSPTIDLASPPPNIKTAEPSPNSATITTTATGLFKPSPWPENVGTPNPFLGFARSHGETMTSPVICKSPSS